MDGGFEKQCYIFQDEGKNRVFCECIGMGFNLDWQGVEGWQRENRSWFIGINDILKMYFVIVLGSCERGGGRDYCLMMNFERLFLSFFILLLCYKLLDIIRCVIKLIMKMLLFGLFNLFINRIKIIVDNILNSSVFIKYLIIFWKNSWKKLLEKTLEKNIFFFLCYVDKE